MFISNGMARIAMKLLVMPSLSGITWSYVLAWSWFNWGFIRPTFLVRFYGIVLIVFPRVTKFAILLASAPKSAVLEH